MKRLVMLALFMAVLTIGGYAGFFNDMFSQKRYVVLEETALCNKYGRCITGYNILDSKSGETYTVVSGKTNIYYVIPPAFDVETITDSYNGNILCDKLKKVEADFLKSPKIKLGLLKAIAEYTALKMGKGATK